MASKVQGRPLRHVLFNESDNDISARGSAKNISPPLPRPPVRRWAPPPAVAPPPKPPTPPLVEVTPPHLRALDEACNNWLGAHGLQRVDPVSAEARKRKHTFGVEWNVSEIASEEAWRLCDAALAAQPPQGEDELFDESILESAAAVNDARRRIALAKRAELSAVGVCDEHLDLPAHEMVPMIHEMVFARAAGATAAARRLMPPPSSWGAAHKWPASPVKSVPPPLDKPLCMVLVSRESEDVSWLFERLPPRVDYHIMQHVRLQPKIPREKQTLMPRPSAVEAKATADEAIVAKSGGRGGVVGSRASAANAERNRVRAINAAMEAAAAAPRASGGPRRSTGHALLMYLAKAAANEELIELLKDPKEANKRVLVTTTDRSQGDEGSIQNAIIHALRKQASRVMDLFRQWDIDNNQCVDKLEFRRAMKALKIVGSNDEYDSLFDSWDIDGGGSIQYTELLAAMHSGRRYDHFQKRTAGPPLPPILVCTHGNPTNDNPEFFDDLALLVRAAHAGREMPPFVPLGKLRSTGEKLLQCDASGCARTAAGAPYDLRLLPIGYVWRRLWGDEDLDATEEQKKAAARIQARIRGRRARMRPKRTAENHAAASRIQARIRGRNSRRAPPGRQRARKNLFAKPAVEAPAASDAPPVPLWFAHTPGGLFAVSHRAVCAPRGKLSATKFYERAISAAGCRILGYTPPPAPPKPAEEPNVKKGKQVVTEDETVPDPSVTSIDDPIAAHAIERMVRYLFVRD